MNGLNLFRMLGDFGVAGAMFAVVLVFLRFGRSERAEHAKDRATFTEIITNHLKEDQRSRADLAIVFRELTATIQGLIGRLNHDR